MPGTKDKNAPSQWFKKAFGFREESFESTKRKFSFADGTLKSNINDKSFHVGPFDVLPLQDLQTRLVDSRNAGKAMRSGGGLLFHNISDSTLDLYLDPANAGAVFQVASLFNCVESDSPATTPEAGVTQGGCQATQGSASASACPAATVFRSYFVNGEGQVDGKQVDCLSEVTRIHHERRERYWIMRNGFCMPTRDFAKINTRFEEDTGFEDEIRKNVQVGIHWDTDVAGGSHRVTQVFCSAAPVSISKSVKVEQWEQFARIILEVQFEATLAAAACLAHQRGQRVRVYLTPVGGGVLGNRIRWIASAIERAMLLHQDAPLDVHLVHLDRALPAYKNLENERWTAVKNKRRTITEDMKRIYDEIEDIEDAEFHELAEENDAEHARKIAKTFEFFDLNGDGVIDRAEFKEILLILDAYFFDEATIDLLIAEADADGDGEVHYSEFAAWICGVTGTQTEGIVNNLFTSSLAHLDKVDFDGAGENRTGPDLSDDEDDEDPTASFELGKDLPQGVRKKSRKKSSAGERPKSRPSTTMSDDKYHNRVF